MAGQQEADRSHGYDAGGDRKKPEIPDDRFNVVLQVGHLRATGSPFGRNPRPPPLGGVVFTSVLRDFGLKPCVKYLSRKIPSVTVAC